jgi:hypothetical protein
MDKKNPSLNRIDSASAKFARVCYSDIVTGSARAMVISKRLTRLGAEFPHSAILSDVYAGDRIPTRWKPFECRECGQIWLGADSARECCPMDY